ncbi:MAG TPA: hypothetical protein PK671_18250, partial [Candidatus Obscuribacter sp.]|nr:hypothetical protein [Candidatus Obscuribacter sp.]
MSALVHRDPLSAWRHLCTLGGLELEGRDEGLDQRILSRLAPQADSIQQALASADMGSFIRAFFEALHPYVAMFRDILDFFEHADATRGESQWTLQVDDIDLGLEHFRQWLAVWDGFAKTGIAVPAIDAKACWELWRVLQNRQTVQDEIQKSFQHNQLNISHDVLQWVWAHKQGTYLPLPKSLNPSQCTPMLAKSAAIALAVLQQLLDQALTPSALMDLYHQHRRSPHFSRTYDPSDGFDLWTIAQHETDHWLRSFLVALSAASRLPESEICAIGEELNRITDVFPVRHVQVNISIGDLESVLSLPVWEKRFDLYSVWIATEMVRALKGHDVEIHHDHGRVAFAFKETTVATIHSSPGPFKLISERRIPLANPRGEGRKGGVQPDHGLWTTNDGGEVCKLVIEVKHYKNSSKAKFVDVFEDYARALPVAEICLVNHGPIGTAIYEVSKTVQSRCRAIGHLTSSNVELRTELASVVRNCVGEPIPRWLAITQPLNSSKVLVIDVSGSMNRTMRSSAMHSFIRHLAELEQPCKLMAADQQIVGVWDTGEDGFNELLHFEGGSTDLSKPVSELLTRHESVLVIT